MNIYGSLMAIFDQKKQENFMNIFDSLMAIFDEKNKDIYVGTMLHAYAHCIPTLCLVLLHTKTRYESLGISLPSFSYLVTLYNPLPR